MGIRHIFLSLIFLEFMVTTTLMLSYQGHLGAVKELVNDLHSKLAVLLWRRGVDETIAPLSIPELMEDCMRRANLDSPALIEPAIGNVEYFYREFRKAIPETSLAGYRSHCWEAEYSVQWDRPPAFNCHGKLGNISFSRDFKAFYPYQSLIFPYMVNNYPKQSYKSSIVCLPNIFVAGFPKCGSTFLYYMVTSLISTSSGDSTQNQVEKETQFWVHFDPFQKIKISVPAAGDLGGYLFNYIPGIEKVAKNKSNTTLVDGTPTYINEWPVFTQLENNITNYCLIPVALPKLLPDSKYFVIMRNPISMLYSNFWFSCTKNSVQIPFQYKGPDVFHQRTVSKITKFNNCMKNESEESISFTCTMFDKENYSSCIKKRLHFLDRCTAHTLPEVYSLDLPHCGDIWLSVGLFYVHIRKWLHLVPRERIKFLTLEEVNINPNLTAHSILDFLDLNNDISDANVNKMMQSGKANSNTQSKVNYKGNAKLQMRRDTRKMLEIFYHPFNALLAELLGDDKYVWF